MVKGVIFDMDGTMFDTERLSSEAWRMAGRKLGIPITEELLANFRGKNWLAGKELLKNAFGEDFDCENARNIRYEFYLEMLRRDGVPIKPGLPELLDFLKEEKIPAVVATSTGREHAERLLKLAGVYDAFADYVYGDSLTASKPEPDIFLMAADRIGRRPQDCLVLEDSPNGVVAGKAAGGYIICIPDIVTVPEEVLDGITAKMENLKEVIGWIKEENQKGE